MSDFPLTAEVVVACRVELQHTHTVVAKATGIDPKIFITRDVSSWSGGPGDRLVWRERVCVGGGWAVGKKVSGWFDGVTEKLGGR